MLAFVAAMAVAPAGAAAAATQQRPTPPAPAQLAPPTAQQLGLAVNYLMMLYAMQAMASSPPVPPDQADAMVHEYFTNGAKATAVPTSGPAAAYFDNAGTALAQVTMDIGNRPTRVPEAGAPAPAQGASPAVAPTATGTATPTATATPTGTATATGTAAPTVTASPTATATAAPTAPAPAGPTGEATPPPAPAPVPATPVTIVQPVATVPVPAPAAPAERQASIPRSTGAAWAGVFAAGAALGALLVAIGAWLRPPRRTAA